MSALSPPSPHDRRRMVGRMFVAALLAVVGSLALAGPLGATVSQDTTAPEEPIGQGTVVDGEQDVVESIRDDVEEEGDPVDIISIAALVAGLLGMLMGGAALARTNRLFDSSGRPRVTGTGPRADPPE